MWRRVIVGGMGWRRGSRVHVAQHVAPTLGQSTRHQAKGATREEVLMRPLPNTGGREKVKAAYHRSDLQAQRPPLMRA